MGKMSFDRCTRVLEYIRRNIKPIIESDEETQDEALERAIEIMHKYEEIKQIMNELNGNFYESYLKDRQTLEKIYEVVKNG